MSDSHEHLEQLILGHFEGSLAPDRENELAKLLERSSDARRVFSVYMRLEGATLHLAKAKSISAIDVDLSEGFDAMELHLADRTETVARLRSRIARTVAVLTTIAAAVLLLTWSTTSYWSKPATTKAQPAIAQLTRSVAAQWESAPREVGANLSPGVLGLVSGLVEIEFTSGVTMILEGPAELELVSRERAFLNFGRLRSSVPPEAFGFTVASANQEVIDLGTEFGFKVARSGAAEIHVFDGEVEIVESTGILSRQLLSAGEAVRFESSGEVSEVSLDTDAFIGAASMDFRAETYIAELSDHLITLQKQKLELSDKLLKEKARIAKLPRIIKLRRESRDSRQKFEKALLDNARLSVAERSRLETYAKLDALINEKIQQSEIGAQRRTEIQEVQTLISDQNGKIERAKQQHKNKKEMRALNGALKSLLKRRSEVSRELSAMRSELRKTDLEVKAAMKRCSAARKNVERLVQRGPLAGLQRRAIEKRKAFRSLHKKLLQRDKNINALAEESKRIVALIAKVKHQIRDAHRLSSVGHLLAVYNENSPPPTNQIQ